MRWLHSTFGNVCLKNCQLFVERNENYYYFYDTTALCWTLAAFSVAWFYIQSVGQLGQGIRPLQGLYLYTEQNKRRINTHITDIHALSGIRTHDLSVRASEDSSCLKLRGHCDRLWTSIISIYSLVYGHKWLIWNVRAYIYEFRTHHISTTLFATNRKYRIT
jgi:hypothetical protein